MDNLVPRSVAPDAELTAVPELDPTISAMRSNNVLAATELITSATMSVESAATGCSPCCFRKE